MNYPCLIFCTALLAATASIARADILTFQQGQNGYTGTQDTSIRFASPNTNFGNDFFLTSDANQDGGPNQVLLRFDNLFGNGARQIPVGSTINSARLSLYVFNPASSSPAIRFHRMRTAWDESTATWNTFGGNGIQQNDTESDAISDAAFPAVGAAETKIINVTTALSGWSVAPETNLGWVIVNTVNNGLDIDSSEGTVFAFRPFLNINFTPAVVTVPEMPAATLMLLALIPGAALTMRHSIPRQKK